MSVFVISCGGTGGHLAPGIALAEALQAHGHTCHLIISRKEVDSRLISKYGHLDFVRSPGVSFSWHPVGLVRFAVELMRGLAFARRFLREKKPQAMLGFGGYITVAMTLAATMARIPVVLHEANRRPGKAVRFLSGLARRIYLPPGVRLRGIPPGTVRECGFPLRREIMRTPRDEARQRLSMPLKGKLLMVMGGSQGAAPLNEWVSENYKRLARHDIHVLCYTGLGKHEEAEMEVTGLDGKSVKVAFRSFCDDMASALSAADLVVSRAGAGSIAEYMRCRLPAILVPYPYAADNHQWENARYFEQQGGGLVIDQGNLETLLDEVVELINNEWLLERFARNLERLDRFSSKRYIINDLEALSRSSDNTFGRDNERVAL